ncbi:GntR family transcriptional regulator [Bradyrhizobium sp.]|uniref:GntR family transcriptional regulator n=1 Tax=Bradyrhizobium sp. TaxID=376 RepID=UPI003C65C367
MSPQPAIPRKSLHNELVTLLRDMIIRGELRPGSRIPESRLCDVFGVSRTPLREALKVLSVEGLVCLLPNRGARVVHVTRKEIEEIVPILGMLAALAGEFACANIKADELARIRCMHAQMLEHYRAGDQDSYSEINRAIHDAIFEIARNKALSDTYNMVQTRLRSILFVTPKVPPQWADAVADHEEMMIALEEKDGARFAKVARRHLCHKADAMRIALDTLAVRTDAKHSGTRLAVG